MKDLLSLLPYFFTPFVMSYLWKKNQWRYKGLTYLLSALLLIAYPFIITWIEDVLFPPQDMKCGNVLLGFIMLCICILLPLSMIFQYIGNYWLLHKNIHKSESI